MKKNPVRVLLLVLVALGVFIALDSGLSRIHLERENRQLELAVEYSELQRLARWSGLTYPELLVKAKERGITGVLFKEETLGELETKNVWLSSGAELGGPGLAPHTTYIVTDDEAMFRRLRQQLEFKAPAMETRSFEGLFLLSSTLGPGELRTLGLGFDEGALAATAEADLNILLQVQSWPQATPEDVRAVVGQALATPGLTALLFNDGVLPGYPRSLEALLQEIGPAQIPLGLIEFFPQQGLSQLVQNLDKRAVRLHAIGEAEMPKMDPAKAVARFTLAATERNNRIIMTRLFFRPEAGDWLAYNLDYLGTLGETLEREGFTLGAARPFASLPIARTRLFFLGMGVLAGGVLLLEKFLAPRRALLWGGAGALGWLALLVLHQVDAGRLLLAWAAVVIFPGLALITAVREAGPGLKGSIGLMLRTSLFSLTGAALMVGLLADVSFMLKIVQFRGVKLAHVIPLLLVVAYCLLWQARGDWWPRLQKFWRTRISVGWAAVALLLGLALLIYISRTGNESIGASGLEMQLRSLLDRALMVRPRTKEFLIGHPALLLFFYLGYQPRYLPLLILGAIGQISLVNTFAHVHTPLLVSLLRAFNGWWLGLLLGIIVILVYRGIVKLGERMEHDA